MKLKSLLLYSLGILLLVFGNREIWDNLKKDREALKDQEKLVADAEAETKRKFEIQELVFDSATSTWSNPYPYFQIVQVGNVNFKALKKKANTKIDSDDSETASDSN